ncbi:response regulator [Dissulfurispira sp.]|uniref:response regulator n=1 Tax=Dissulfurispira sp. TaxID=2817609 RepID=UPI002FD8E781
MHGFMGSIAVIGAGKGGSALLSVLLKEPNINVVGIADINPNAPGLDIAKQFNIPITNNFKELAAKKPDIIINVTGDSSITAEILKILKRKSPGTEVIDGQSAKLIWDLLEKRRQSKEETKALLNETKDLYRIGVALTSADKLEEALDTLMLEALRTVNAPAGSIALYDEKSDALTLKAAHGFSKDFSHVVQWKRRDGGMTDHILSKRIPTVIPDIETYPFVDNRNIIKEGIKSIVAVPLFANDHTIGILYIDDFKPRNWTQREIEFITLLGIQAAYAIEKFRLIEAISETQNYLKNVLDNSADIIITTDTEGSIVEFNRGASRLLGYSKEEIIGEKAENLWVRPGERNEILKILEREGYVSNHETQLITKDGRNIDVSLTLSFILSSKKGIIGTVGIGKDITEKKKLERAIEERNLELHELNEKLEEKVIERTMELEKANSELERSNRLKSQFIATMSHELRTPLNSILGFSELLMDEVFGTLTEKQKRYVNNIYNSGSHLLQLINNILDIAKIESGKMELHYEAFSVRHAISEVETVIKPLTDKKNQNLNIKIDNKVSVIKADKVKFKQILYNLLSNAVKFTQDGGDIFLETELISSENISYSVKNPNICPGNESCLRISVTDTGIGIKKENHEKIFSEFEQVDSSFSRRYEGTGLGLALTKKLVELHGGEIFVESEEGKGSRFTVILPLFDIAAMEKVAKIKEPELIEEPVYDVDISRNRRGDAPLILVVEDDPSTSELLTLYLAQGGYRVAHAYNGDTAIGRIKELKPFAVLLDVMLPGKDGWEILQEMKSDPEMKDIPVIISSVIDNRELGFTLGASDYLVKPVDRITLLRKLEELSFTTKKGRRPVNILCIDDHDDVLELLTSILEPSGYNVITANSGRQGIEKAVAYRPDLVILDLMMPEVDGFEVAQILKNNPTTMDIPILILTAKDLTVDDRLRLAGKIEDCIQKSHFTKEDLLMHIRDLEVTYPARAGLLDEVSGLFDHCYFQIRLAQEVSRAGRYKNTFTLLMLDLDNFTDYIKAHGIHRSNIVIRKIAEFLRKSLRGSDTVVRYGIDEFGVILPSTLKASAEAVAKRFLAYIDSYPFYGEEVMPQGKITATVSVINYPRDASSPEELIFKAHQTLRKAKEGGGQKVVVYEQ